MTRHTPRLCAEPTNTDSTRAIRTTVDLTFDISIHPFATLQHVLRAAYLTRYFKRLRTERLPQSGPSRAHLASSAPASAPDDPSGCRDRGKAARMWGGVELGVRLLRFRIKIPIPTSHSVGMRLRPPMLVGCLENTPRPRVIRNSR